MTKKLSYSLFFCLFLFFVLLFAVRKCNSYLYLLLFFWSINNGINNYSDVFYYINNAIWSHVSTNVHNTTDICGLTVHITVFHYTVYYLLMISVIFLTHQMAYYFFMSHWALQYMYNAQLKCTFIHFVFTWYYNKKAGREGMFSTNHSITL